MDTLIGLLFLSVLATLLLGIICLFRKGRRKRSLLWFGATIILFIGTAQLIGLSDDWKAQEAGYASHVDQKDAELKAEQQEQKAAEQRIEAALNKKAQKAGYEDHEAQKLAEAKAAREEKREQAQLAEEARTKALNGFPDAATQASAKTAGITRYEAYKLLDSDKAISRYCAYTAQGYGIEKDKHSQMDAVANEAAKAKVWDKYEDLQKQLLDTFNNDLGLVEFEYINLSTAGYWNWYCRAAEDNWSVMTEQQAKAATRADAKEATEALRAFYQYNLDKEASLFFSKKRYSTVYCEWKNHNNMRFVGCRLQSFSYQSKWQMFLVGRIDSGRLAVYPINGDTSGKLGNAQARFQDQSFKDRIFVKAYEQPHAYLARYAGPRIDIAAVRKSFE